MTGRREWRQRATWKAVAVILTKDKEISDQDSADAVKILPRSGIAHKLAYNFNSLCIICMENVISMFL